MRTFEKTIRVGAQTTDRFGIIDSDLALENQVWNDKEGGFNSYRIINNSATAIAITRDGNPNTRHEIPNGGAIGTLDQEENIWFRNLTFDKIVASGTINANDIIVTISRFPRVRQR